MDRWTKSDAVIFGLSITIFEFLVSLIGSSLTNYTIAVQALEFSIDTKLILLFGATLVPAIFCFLGYSEPRAAIRKVKAGFFAYLFALVAGLIPFTGYFVTRYSVTWAQSSPVRYFANYILLNLLLMPLWTAITWQGCFLKRVGSFLSVRSGILFSSFFLALSSAGQIAFLRSQHYALQVLIVLSLVYFCIGVIACCVFEFGGGSLWPSVLVLLIFNASSSVFFIGDRRAELAPYFAELLFSAIFSWILFWITSRQTKSEAGGPAQRSDSSMAPSDLPI